MQKLYGTNAFLKKNSLEQSYAACVNLQYRMCRTKEDNVSVSSSSLPPGLYSILYPSLCFFKIPQMLDLVVLREKKRQTAAEDNVSFAQKALATALIR